MVSNKAFTAITLLAIASRSFAQDSTPTTLASLYSSNPTAVPLTSIDSTLTTQPTHSITSPAKPGATAPISGAPPLPNFEFSVALGFPGLDDVPFLNSTEVEGWIAAVKATGITIPDIPLSKDGSCESDPAKVANPSYCWWTCGGCTRETDITTCPDKLTWGLSYDDGPSPWSGDLLQYLDAASLHSTFFIVGSRAISYPDILQAEYLAGHQLSVHTWSHPYLTTLTNEQIIAELGWTKKAIHDITGVTPNTFRPPYGDIDDRVRAIAKAMDLVPIMWSNISTNYFDTDDWHIPAGYPVDAVIDNFEAILANASSMDTGFIVLEHDLYPQTIDLAIGYILPDALARHDLQLKSIIECLHQPLANAYIETNNNATNPLGAATTFPASGTPATTTPASGSGIKSSTKSSTASATHGSSAAPSTTSSAAGPALQVSMAGVGASVVAGGVALAMSLFSGALAL